MNIRSCLIMLCLALAAGFLPVRAAAADMAGEFAAANKLYAEGRFADAAAAYEKSIQEGVKAGSVSAALYFNDGNAEFKLGHLGRAIEAYRRAALLTPRDSEILGNLAFARNQVQGATMRPGRWQGWVGSLTLDEGACLTAVLFWVTLGLLIARQLRPGAAARIKGLTLTVGAVTVLSVLVLAVQAAGRFSRETAVVTEANVVTRSGPFDDAQNAFPVHDGAELTVLDRHDQWWQVTDGTGKIGWLPRRQIAVLPGA